MKVLIFAGGGESEGGIYIMGFALVIKVILVYNIAYLYLPLPLLDIAIGFTSMVNASKWIFQRQCILANNIWWWW